MTTAKNKINKGFTLIELLIVMAILGVLAVVVLIAINPIQQLARTRDTGRISSVTQIGRALQAYAASHPLGTYPAQTGWDTSLTNSGQLDRIPAEINNTQNTNAPCTDEVVNGWCYDVANISGQNDCALIYAHIEANANAQLCGGSIPGNIYAAYDTCVGRGGITDDITDIGNTVFCN